MRQGDVSLSYSRPRRCCTYKTPWETVSNICSWAWCSVSNSGFPGEGPQSINYLAMFLRQVAHMLPGPTFNSSWCSFLTSQALGLSTRTSTLEKSIFSQQVPKVTLMQVIQRPAVRAPVWADKEELGFCLFSTVPGIEPRALLLVSCPDSEKQPAAVVTLPPEQWFSLNSILIFESPGGNSLRLSVSGIYFQRFWFNQHMCSGFQNNSGNSLLPVL